MLCTRGASSEAAYSVKNIAQFYIYRGGVQALL